MLIPQGTILRTMGLLAALLAVTGSLAAADPDCVAKACCPQPTQQKTSTVVYGENVKDVCFPPTPCMRLKRCLGLVPDGACDGCSGSPRQVHRLTTRSVTEEKCSVTYEPVLLCPHDSSPLPAGPEQSPGSCPRTGAALRAGSLKAPE